MTVGLMTAFTCTVFFHYFWTSVHQAAVAGDVNNIHYFILVAAVKGWDVWGSKWTVRSSDWKQEKQQG